MIMEKINFDDKRFVLCKHFITVSNRGKGQNIRIRINHENVKEFLNTKLIQQNEAKPKHKFWLDRGAYGDYLERVVRTIETSLKRFDVCYYLGSGDWRGQIRMMEMLLFEESLKQIKKIYCMLDDFGFDEEFFNCITKFELLYDNKTLTINMIKDRADNCLDMAKFIKFLNMIGYEAREFQPAANLYKLLIFETIDTKKLEENKEIIEFL